VLARGDRAWCLKYLLILILHRCLDEALWFIETATKRQIFSQPEAEAMIAEILALAPKPYLYQRADKVGFWARRIRKWLNIGRARKIEYWMDRSWDH